MHDANELNALNPAPAGPRTTRIRHELTRRRLTVARVEPLPPSMIRIVLGGEELRGFTSLGFDDHVKIFFPTADGQNSHDGEALRPAMRDFTPRHFDAEAGELWIDFYLHQGGPAATWAAQATVGQALEIGGPKGSAVIALEDIDAHVFIGDETALPAIGRRLAELPASSRALVVLEVDTDADRPALTSSAALDVVHVPRVGHGPPAHALIDALRGLELPSGRCFVWIACESQAARAIRGYLRLERGLDKKWIKAAGYWQRGAAGAHDSIQEEA